MGLHDHVVGHLEVADQSGSVQDLDAEFSLDGVVNFDAGPDVAETCSELTYLLRLSS